MPVASRGRRDTKKFFTFFKITKSNQNRHKKIPGKSPIMW